MSSKILVFHDWLQFYVLLLKFKPIFFSLRASYELLRASYEPIAHNSISLSPFKNPDISK